MYVTTVGQLRKALEQHSNEKSILLNTGDADGRRYSWPLQVGTAGDLVVLHGFPFDEGIAKSKGA